MDGPSILEVLGVLIIAFVFGVMLPVSLTLLFVKYRGGPAQMYQLGSEVKAGKVADFLPWGSTSLGELTREWVGDSAFTRSMFGRHDQRAGRVPSARTDSGWLLAFTMESKNDAADGRLVAVTSAHRVDLRVSSGVCHATVNGATLGTFKWGEPELRAPDGSQLGSYRRGGQLALRGRDVATIDSRTSGAPARPPAVTPLVTNLAAERTPEEEAWTLVLAVMELGWGRTAAS